MRLPRRTTAATAALLSAAAAVGAGCGSDPGVVASVRVGGSTTLLSFVQQAAAAFTEQNPLARVRDLDEEGIDIAVMFTTMGLRFAGVADPGLAGALCCAYNDWLADFCRAAPDRLVGVAAVPLQDVDAAIAEAQRAVDAGVSWHPCAAQPRAGAHALPSRQRPSLGGDGGTGRAPVRA